MPGVLGLQMFAKSFWVCLDLGAFLRKEWVKIIFFFTGTVGTAVDFPTFWKSWLLAHISGRKQTILQIKEHII